MMDNGTGGCNDPYSPSVESTHASGVSGFSGMGLVEWWNSGMVEWCNEFFSRSFCLLVCVLTIIRSIKQRSVYNSLHR